MRTPLQVLTDWTEVRRLKAGWESALAQTRPGCGIRIENLDRPVVARALIELLEAHPTGLELLDFGMRASLMRTATSVRSMSPQLHAKLRGQFQILNADGVVALGMRNKAELPAHEFRGGVPADYNGDGGATFGVQFDPASLIVKP